jgi:hypothetical protein
MLVRLTVCARLGPTDVGHHPVRFIDEPAVGEPEHPVAGELERGVAAPVALERSAAAMEFEPVKLDDHPLLWPQEVHLEAGDRHVDRRLWQHRFAAQAEKAAFELGTGLGEGR